MNVKVVIHYAKDDPNFDSDYCGVSIYPNASKVQEYGDWYHEKGYQKAQGFIDGLKALIKHQADIERVVFKIESIEECEIADAEC